MNIQTYPNEVDCVWVASDGKSQLGAFITGGSGPIPSIYFEIIGLPLESIEELILELPETSDSRLLVSVKRPDSFIELAKRGFYVFDWRDVHRTKPEITNLYEAVALPIRPLSIKDLTPSLMNAARALRLSKTDFSAPGKIDVAAQLKCRFP